MKINAQGPQSHVTDLSSLNLSAVQKLLEKSLDGNYVEVTDDTFYLLDVSTFQGVGYQSILIQRCGMMYKSLETTNKLLENFSKKQFSAHEVTNFVAETLNYKQKIPYLIGDRAVIPDIGYTKKPASWLVLNQVQHSSFNFEKKLVYLSSQTGFNLVIYMSKDQFEKQVERAAHIYKIKLILHKQMIKSYRYCYQMPLLKGANIFDEAVERVSYAYPCYTHNEIIQDMKERVVTKKLKEVLGEGNPFYDDYIQKMKLK